MSDFNLETAIATWRQFHERQPAFSADDLDELERHLRDHTARLVAAGETEAEAFRQAVQQVGDVAGGATEYEKVQWDKLRRTRRVGQTLRVRAALMRMHARMAARLMGKQMGYVALTVGGLAVGLACAWLLMQYIQHEQAYDQGWLHAEQTYRVTTTEHQEGAATAYATTVPALAEAMHEQLPSIATATRLMVEATESNESLFAVEDQRFYESQFAWADEAFFEVFPYRFMQGDSATALNRPFTIVITEAIAQKYFGETPALGETLKWNGQLDLEVTGVIATPTGPTHLPFGLLGALETFNGLGANGMIDNWGWRGFYTYARLAEGITPQAATTDLATLAADRPEVSEATTFGLQAVSEIHLHSNLEEELGPNGSHQIVQLFGAIAIILLFVSGVNFVNLTTARSMQRAQEIGVRKVLGAYRKQLAGQFMTEALVLVVGGGVLALGLCLAFAAQVTALTGAPIAFSSTAVATLLVGALGVGLLAGLYPAAYLSSFKPIRALQGGVQAGRGHRYLRSGLVVGQFALSAALIAITLGMTQQLRYLQQADLGFDQAHVVALPLHSVFGQPQQDMAQLRAGLLALPGVQAVAQTSQLPSRVFVNNEAVRLADETAAREVTAFAVDSTFVCTLGLTVEMGQDLANAPADAVLINEAAAQSFGWANPVGEVLYQPGNGDRIGTVAGVVADFNIQSMQHGVGPVLIRRGQPWDYQYLTVRVAGHELSHTLEEMAEVWASAAPAWPFTYLFLDAEFDALYAQVERAGRMVSVFALLAVFVACLGLIGLMAYTVKLRTKEIGVRKVLGASVPGVVGLLSRETIGLAGIAVVLAIPIAYVVIQRWLDGFAYRIDPSLSLFIGTSLLVLLIALLTVSYQSIKAALADPVESLRYE
ncbi:MAG: ABC transporter permease [Rhodothermales bacterium]